MPVSILLGYIFSSCLCLLYSETTSLMNNKQTLTPKARLYCPDFTIKEITPANGSYFTLEEMQGYVGGLIQIIPLDGEGHEDRLLVVHEEGKLIGLPYNLFATLVWQVYYGDTDYISGNALISHPSLIR